MPNLLAQATPITSSQLTNLSNQIGLRYAGGQIGSLFGGRYGLIAIAITLSGFGLLIYLISGGFSLMTSGGDPQKVAKGKAKIQNALIGFVIVLTSYIIVQAIGLILGLETIKSIFGT